jgi:MarR family transcriptional regulator, organic hydroperoxide resistance regulator
MIEIGNIYDMAIDALRKVLYPEEWINLDLSLSKSEIFALLQADRNGEIIMSQIADYINIPMSTATGLIERLVKKGYIERLRSESDRRIVTIRLTDAGKKLTNDLKDTVKGYIQLIYDCLSNEERDLLFGIITKVTNIITSSKKKDETGSEGSGIKKIEIE